MFRKWEGNQPIGLRLQKKKIKKLPFLFFSLKLNNFSVVRFSKKLTDLSCKNTGRIPFTLSCILYNHLQKLPHSQIVHIIGLHFSSLPFNPFKACKGGEVPKMIPQFQRSKIQYSHTWGLHKNYGKCML